MNLDIPIEHSCDIKCPKCRHTYLYNFKIQDMKEISNKNDLKEKEYEFLTYLICKNPLCNYDIEIKGRVIKSHLDMIKSINITSAK